MSRESKLAKNTVILSIGTFLPKLASFITLPILTGYLTKVEYGTYDLVSVLVSLLLPAATLEIQVAAFRFLIDVRNDEDAVKTIVTNIVLFILPTSLVALIVLYFFLPGQATIVRLFICLYFLADITVNCARQICRGLSRTLDYSLSAIISALGKVIFVVICIRYLKAGLLGTVISLFGASSASLLYLVFRVKLYKYFDISKFDKNKLYEMLKYSWPMVPNSMSAWVMRVSDRLVVTAVMGPAANAVYSVANKLPSLLNLAQTTFTMAWQENAAIVSKDADASEYYSSMFRVILNLLTGFFCLLIALTPFLFRILIRGNYNEAINQMPILFVAMYFLGLSTYLGGIFIAYKRSNSIGITTVVAATINLLVDLGTIRFIGLYAASGSTLISYLFLFVFRLFTVQRIVKVKYNPGYLMFSLVLIFASTILFYFQNTHLNIINLIYGLIVFYCLNESFVKAVIRKVTQLARRHMLSKQ